jgi:hypothetical protein
MRTRTRTKNPKIDNETKLRGKFMPNPNKCDIILPRSDWFFLIQNIQEEEEGREWAETRNILAFNRDAISSLPEASSNCFLI